MDYNKLAQLLFPNVTETCEYYEEKFPQRDLSEGAKVTRFAPSPTGFLHIVFRADIRKSGAPQRRKIYITY